MSWLYRSFLLGVFPCSSGGSPPREMVLRELLQCGSFPWAAVLPELIQCGSFPWGAVVGSFHGPAARARRKCSLDVYRTLHPYIDGEAHVVFIMLLSRDKPHEAFIHSNLRVSILLSNETSSSLENRDRAQHLGPVMLLQLSSPPPVQDLCWFLSLCSVSVCVYTHGRSRAHTHTHYSVAWFKARWTHSIFLLTFTRITWTCCMLLPLPCISQSSCLGFERTAWGWQQPVLVVPELGLIADNWDVHNGADNKRVIRYHK